ncbi:MAG: hypothetical protein ACI8P0_003328 [Planctomycetaceae bacterium]|jgi:hypothetical protein
MLLLEAFAEFGDFDAAAKLVPPGLLLPRDGLRF